MLSNYEHICITSTTNQWPQTDESMLMAASSGRIMEKPTKELALKCPRCESSNTKFCYYNNYSLSQPRYFCKACKRYWTKGGTLRNVPVGGGCRKNKRVKKPAASSLDLAPSLPITNTTSTNQIVGSTALSHVNSMFYGLPNHPSGYDFQPQFNALGLGFSSATTIGEDYRSGFNSTTNIQDIITSNSLLSNFSLFGSSSSSTSSTPVTASMMASSFQQRNLILESDDMKETRPINLFQALSGDPPMTTVMKDVKLEEGSKVMSNKVDLSIPCQNPIEQIGSFDSSSFWNWTNVGSWPDLSNYGSSVTHLI